jgi:hypothetical protein
LLLSCMEKFLIPADTKDRAQRYKVFFATNAKHSGIFRCDDETKSLVEDFNHPDNDFFLCFSSTFFGKPKVGKIFFQLDHNVPKISKIKW